MREINKNVEGLTWQGVSHMWPAFGDCVIPKGSFGP